MAPVEPWLKIAVLLCAAARFFSTVEAGGSGGIEVQDWATSASETSLKGEAVVPDALKPPSDFLAELANSLARVTRLGS